MANNTGRKFGGRQKGTPNRLTKDLRLILKDVIYLELNSLIKQLDELDARERIDVLIKLMPFVFPKMHNANYTINEPADWDIL